MENWIGVATSIGTGVIFVLVGLPLMRGAVEPNTLYGFRTKRTLSDRDLWYAVNALSGKHFVVTGALMIVLGIIGLGALNDPDQQKVLVLAAVAIILLGIAYTILRSWQVIEQHTDDPDDR